MLFVGWSLGLVVSGIQVPDTKCGKQLARVLDDPFLGEFVVFEAEARCAGYRNVERQSLPLG